MSILWSNLFGRNACMTAFGYRDLLMQKLDKNAFNFSSLAIFFKKAIIISFVAFKDYPQNERNAMSILLRLK